MKRGAKRWLTALLACVVALGVWKAATYHRNRRQELAFALKLAGFPEDDAGRIILTPDTSGVSLAYDPNRRGPTVGFRGCMGSLVACLDATKHMDPCVRDVKRCVSSTPWKDDPAGDDCCPESCVQEYLELRKKFSEEVAGGELARGTCYPGMKELLRRGGRMP